jgi:hypothetical protein
LRKILDGTGRVFIPACNNRPQNAVAEVFLLDNSSMFGYNVLARSKNDTASKRLEPLAQMAEHLTFNQRVRGSNPRWLTKYKPPEIGLKSSLPAVFLFAKILAQNNPKQAKTRGVTTGLLRI